MLSEMLSVGENFKFTNPIRDYSHLLGNRLVAKIIDLEAGLGESKVTKEAQAFIKKAGHSKPKAYTEMRTRLQSEIKRLNGLGKSITEYARTVAKYKNEAQYVE